MALVGDNRSGKTIFLCDTVLNSMFPWWYRFFLAPRGLFLTGAQKHPTIDAWLKNQIATNERNDPSSALADLLLQRRREQRIRHFPHKLFKDRVPDLWKPQPPTSNHCDRSSRRASTCLQSHFPCRILQFGEGSARR